MKSTTIDKSLKVAQILLNSGAITFMKNNKPFRFTSGILSPIYVDNRRLISLPKEREIVVDLLIEKIKKLGKIDTVAGVATAGIPHTAWVAQKLNLPMIFVRSKPKEYGGKNQVEGILKRGQNVLVIEDMISTAKSSASVIEVLRKMGTKVDNEIAIYTHTIKESEIVLKKLNIKLHTLTNLRDVLTVAQKEKYLKKNQLKVILEWIKNPKGWGGKHN